MSLTLLRKPITSPTFDAVLGGVSGIICFVVGLDMFFNSEYREVGATFAFIGIVNIFNSFRMWRRQRRAHIDVLAVRAALRDLENGERGQSMEEFSAEFRRRNQL